MGQFLQVPISRAGYNESAQLSYESADCTGTPYLLDGSSAELLVIQAYPGNGMAYYPSAAPEVTVHVQSFADIAGGNVTCTPTDFASSSSVEALTLPLPSIVPPLSVTR
jgi:hypothetical protein